MRDFLSPSIVAIKEAGEIARRLFGHSKIERLKGNDDLATNADLLIEEYLFNFVKKEFPDHGFDSEESEIYYPDAEYIWILDPIDGTKYFYQNIPLYSISLALQHNKKSVLGIIYIPETNEVFNTAIYNQKESLRNGFPINCSAEKLLEDMSIIMELPNRNDPDNIIDTAMAIMQSLLKKVKRIRILGVGSISLSYCAMGGFDAYINLNVSRKHYDFAAGRVVLEQAGGQYYETNQMIIGGRKENINNILDFLHQNKLLH